MTKLRMRIAYLKKKRLQTLSQIM